MSRDIVESLYGEVSKKHGRNLTGEEKKDILGILGMIDFTIFAGKSKENVIGILSDVIIEEFNKKQPKSTVILSSPDKVKDYLSKEILVPENIEQRYLTKIFENEKVYIGDGVNDDSEKDGNDDEEIDITEILGIKSLTTLKIFLNPESLYTYNYLALDTNYRDETGETGTTVKRFSWRYTENINLVRGFCNSQRRISNIIAVRLYQPRVPYIAAMDTSSKRVSLLIEEFSAQSYILPNGVKFHFVLRPEYTQIGTGYVELATEDYDDSIYKFRKPITEFPSISLVFGNPGTVLEWAKPVSRFLVCFEFICIKE
jgi:hypothetical protein